MVEEVVALDESVSTICSSCGLDPATNKSCMMFSKKPGNENIVCLDSILTKIVIDNNAHSTKCFSPRDTETYKNCLEEGIKIMKTTSVTNKFDELSINLTLEGLTNFIEDLNIPL